MGVKDLFQLGAVYEHSFALQQQRSNVCYHREQSQSQSQSKKKVMFLTFLFQSTLLLAP